MSNHSRRSFFISLVVPLTITAAACSKNPESKQVAIQFMDDYYVQMNLKNLAPLTSGLAKEKIDQQLLLLEGTTPEPPSGKPRVTYDLVSSKTDSPDEASYIFSVDVHIQDMGKRKVYIKVRNEGSRWMITQFQEEDSEP